MTRLIQTERDILDSICEYLAYRGYFFWRSNNTPIYDPYHQKFRSMPKYARKGVSDIICVVDGKIHCIEVKRPDGRQRPDQKEFQISLESQGKGKYYLVHSLDELREAGF